MSRIQRKATEIGLLICERFSKATLEFISEWDPDLHYDIMKARKSRGIRNDKENNTKQKEQAKIYSLV